MADKPKASEAAAEGGEAAAPKKGNGKTIMVVAVVMVLEAVAVFFVVGMTNKPPAAAEAKLEHTAADDLEATVEISLVDDRFQNMQTGRVWVWDSEIVLQVKRRHEEFVNAELERRQAEVKEGVSMIFRRSPHAQLKEPGLETLNRQVSAFVNNVLGKDAEGKERVVRILIPKCKGFPTE